MVTKPILPFRVKIVGWESELTIRAYDAEDARLVTQLMFKISSEKEITARPGSPTPPANLPFNYGPMPREDMTLLSPQMKLYNGELILAPQDTPIEHRGRPRRNVSPRLICDALRKYQDVGAAARALGISRAYIYRDVGVIEIKHLITGEV